MNKVANWSEYWENEGSSGEVFVGKEGKKHPYLTKFWGEHLDKFKDGVKIVDLACGAGSVYSDNIRNRNFQLYAVDISAEALATLSTRLPGVTTIESSVTDIPLDSGAFDLVVSQFGIEYAGEGAFVEATRLMAKGARLIVLCHIKNGFIDSKNRIELKGAKLLKQTGFIEKATEVTTACFKNEKKAFEKSFNAFTKIEPEVSAFVESHDQGIHSHCYLGFRKLYERKSAYELHDITEWLNAMKVEVDKSILRLGEMRKAAQSKKQISAINRALKENGLTNINIEPFKIPGHQLPLAWCITGNKN